MRVIVKLGNIEVVVEAQDAEEVKLLSQVVRGIVGDGLTYSASDFPNKPSKIRHTESELNQSRISAIEWVLETSRLPMSAPEIAEQVREVDVFQTRNGNPIHIVRRVLADRKFEKTLSGLFRLNEGLIKSSTYQEAASISERKVFSTPDDDMDDPFADN